MLTTVWPRADEPEEATRSARHSLDLFATGEAAAESDLDTGAILTLNPKTSPWTKSWDRCDCQGVHPPLGSKSSACVESRRSAKVLGR
jgi:hypothetical protein